jgi:hypothetical protein
LNRQAAEDAKLRELDFDLGTTSARVIRTRFLLGALRRRGG